jgi:cytochrome b subunit of formate dehydrogenase
MNRGTVGLTLAIFDVVGYTILSVWGVGIGPEMADPVSSLMFGIPVLAFSMMGALLVRRVPNNPVGALLLAVATVQVGAFALSAYAYLGTAATPQWPVAAVAGAFGEVGYFGPFALALIGIPLLFPDGRLPSRRFRLVVWISAAAMVVLLLPGLALLTPDLVDVEVISNVGLAIAFVAISLGFVGASAAVWIRFRRGDRVEREQLKWLLAVAGVAVISFPPAILLGSTDSFIALALWLIGFMAYLALPVAIAIAVLRYRLYEIDVIINRALVYVPLTALVAGFYAASIALVGRLLAAAGQSSDIAIVLTTLVVVVIFTPVKNAVQATVDRRFKVVPPPAESPQAVILDPTELLHKLGGLRDAGLLTADEFEAKKRDILDRL